MPIFDVLERANIVMLLRRGKLSGIVRLNVSLVFVKSRGVKWSLRAAESCESCTSMTFGAIEILSKQVEDDY